MVLAELGGDLSHALRNMSSAIAPVDDSKVLAEFLSEKSRAFLQDDVQFKMAVLNMVASTKRVVDELASGHRKRRSNQEVVFDKLCRMSESGKLAVLPKNGKPSVIMFVGLQGSGKTATCTNYAYHCQKKGRKPVFVCADIFRASAFNQLKQNAAKAKIPFYGSYTEADPVKIAQEGVHTFKKENCDLVIVDSSGGHKQEGSLFEEIQQIAEATKPDLVVFVMDRSLGQNGFDEEAQAFKLSAAVGEVIVANIDCHATGVSSLRHVLPSKNITATTAGNSLQSSLPGEVHGRLKQTAVCKETATEPFCPDQGSECQKNLETADWILSLAKGKEQDDDEDDDDDDDDDDDYEEEDEDDDDNKVEAGGDDEEDVGGEGDEGDDEGEDDGEVEDNREGEGEGDNNDDDDDEEGEKDVDGDENGVEDQEEEEEEEEDEDQDPEEEDEEGDSDEDVEPPRKKQK